MVVNRMLNKLIYELIVSDFFSNTKYTHDDSFTQFDILEEKVRF